MRTERVEDLHSMQLAMEIQCPICKADVGCACDQFQAPHPFPFTVHIERLDTVLYYDYINDLIKRITESGKENLKTLIAQFDPEVRKELLAVVDEVYANAD